MRPQGGPSDRGERQEVQPEKRGRPGGSPAPRGEKRQGKREKKMRPTGPEGGLESKDEKRPVERR